MEQDELLLLISLASFLVAVISAIASWRSASAAKASAEHAQHVETRSLVRQIVSDASKVTFEFGFLESFADDLKAGYKIAARNHGAIIAGLRKDPVTALTAFWRLSHQ